MQLSLVTIEGALFVKCAKYMEYFLLNVSFIQHTTEKVNYESFLPCWHDTGLVQFISVVAPALQGCFRAQGDGTNTGCSGMQLTARKVTFPSWHMTCRWPLLLDRGRQGESTHLIYMPWDRLHALSGDNLLANPKKEQFVPNVEQRLSICMGKHDFTCTNLQLGFGSRRNIRVPEHSASVSRFGKPDTFHAIVSLLRTQARRS